MHGLFGYKHIIILIACIIVIILSYLLIRKQKLEKVVLGMLIIGIISETIKVIYYIVRNEATHGGYLPKSDLPFHLCSIQIIFITILHYSKNEKLKRLLMSFMLPSCLIGGIAALLIPTHSARNGMWIISLQYFGYHVAISTFALYLLTNKDIKWTVKDLVNSFKLLGLFGLISIYINSMLNDGSGDINFMYTVKPPQDGLPYLNLDQGWFMYILKYALLAVVAIIGTYIKPIIDFVKSIKNKNQNELGN
jgi:hypothetical integral membrane protein (TIGR02206 family)